MERDELNKAFDRAIQIASETTKELPPDIQLSLYAHYKHATKKNNIVPYSRLADNDLRGAFKYNAMMQVKGLTIMEAKNEYIELVEKYIVGEG